ncbi:unnamed protein product [Closterium sp. NIES-64]|nr:unnamed protein product [Closterium sp. NIES-64]
MDEASKGSPHAHFFLQDAACASLRTFFGLQPLVPPLMLVPVSARNVADASDRQGGGGGAGGGAGAGGGRNGDESSSPLHGFSSSPLSPYGHSSARKKNRSIGTLKLQVRKVRMTSKGDEGRGGDGGQGEGENQGSAGGAAGGTGGTGGAGGAVSSMMRQIKGGMANLRGLAAEATTAAPEGVLVAVRCPSEEAGEARRVNPNTHHCINLPVQWRAIDKKWWWRMTAMGAAGGQATCAFSPPFFSPPFFSPPFFSPPFFSPPFFSPPLFSPPFFFLSPLFLSHLQTHGEQSTTSGGGGAWPQWVKWAANSGVEVHLPHLYLTPSLPSLSSLPTLPSLPSLPFRPVESDRQEEIAINPPQPVESDRQEVVVEVHDRSGLRGQATVAAAVPLLPSHPSLPSLPSLAPLPIRPVESERQEVVVEVHDRSGSRGQASVAASTLMDEGHPGAHVSLSQRCHWLAVRDTCQQEVARVQLAVSLVPCARDYGTQVCGNFLSALFRVIRVPLGAGCQQPWQLRDSTLAPLSPCQPITESAAYDWVLAAAMAAQGFHARNLRLSGPWEWLCDQFATCYGVSPHYTKLRYLTRVMDVATPTADCLTLIHQLLAPVLHAHDSDGSSVTKQEARMLADMEERVGGLLQLTFESYKSLSEASPSASPIAHFPPPPPTSLQPSVLIPPQARMLADMEERARMLADMEERVGDLLQLTFESYKSLNMEERVGDLLQLTFESYKSLSAHASRHGGESRRPPATHLRELQVAQRGFPFRHRQLLCTATHISAPLCSPPPQARMLADMEERVGDLLQLTFESYKSLSEASPSGIADSSRSATHLCASLGRSLVGAEAAALVAPAIPPAVHLFGLLNDLLLPEVQQQFCGYLQVSLGYYWEQGCKGWGREGHWGDRWWGQRRPHERRSVLRRLKTLLLSRGITGSRGVRAGEGKGTGEIAGGGRGGRTGDAGDSPCGVPVWAAERLAAARGAAAVLRLPAAARRRCRQHLSETDEYVNGTFCVLVLRSHLPHSPLPSHTDSSEAAVPATLVRDGRTAARRRCRQHLSETDEYVNGTFCLGTGGSTMQAQAQGQAGMGCSPGGGRGRGGGGPGGMGAGGMGRGAMRGGEGGDMEEQREAYGSMRLACVAMWREVQADIGIHNQHILPSFVDLPELTAGVYMVELQRRVNQFLLAVPPQHPLPHVKNLLHATADVEDRLMLWGVGKVPGGLDARELFGVYVEAWIRERTHTLMDVCRAPKWAVLAPMSDRNATSPFMEEVYSVINSLLDELDSVLGRWPQYTLLVEEAVCDVERAAISSLASHFQNFLLLLNTPSSSSAPSSTKKKLLGMLSRRRPTLAYQVPIEVSPSLAVPIEVSPSLAVPIEVSPSLAVPIEVSPSLALPIEANGFPTPIVLPAFPALPLPALPLPALPLPALPLPALPLPALPLPPSLPLRASPFPPLSPFQLAVYLNMIWACDGGAEDNVQGNTARRGGETIRECEYGGGGREVLFGEVLFGEMLSEVTVELRTTYRATLQDVVEKLYENTQLGLTTSQKRVPHHIAEASAQEGPFLMEPHNTQLGRTTSLTRVLKETQLGRTTSLKRVLKEVRPQAGDDMTSKLQPLSALIGSLLAQADAVLSSRVFVGTARGLWDRHGREVLHFLEKRREGVSWFKSASAAITLDTLDNLFTQQMQRLQGHSLMERDLEPPRAICDARGVLSKGGAPAATARVHDSLSLY